MGYLYKLAKGNLGSIRGTYLRGNRIPRYGDFAEHDEVVLLIHGFFQTRNVWRVMEDRLRADGYGVVSFDLGGLFGALSTRGVNFLAQKVGDKLERLCRRYDIRRVHLLGHSNGGLVARQYIQRFGGHRRAMSLITLGTPHHGTPVAALGLWVVGGGLLSISPWQMLPGSKLLREMGRDTFPPDIPLISIYSRSDLVVPYPFSVLHPRPGETSMRNFPVKGPGHTALTWEPEVYLLVRAQLREASKLWRQRSQDSL